MARPRLYTVCILHNDGTSSFVRAKGQHTLQAANNALCMVPAGPRPFTVIVWLDPDFPMGVIYTFTDKGVECRV